MDNITDILISFSDKHDLWTLTKKCALECIDNTLKEDREIKIDQFPGLTSKDFTLEKANQQLIFVSHGNKTFIVRTTFNLYSDSVKNANIGTYSLDVDSKGEIIDDWLVFH